MTRAGFALLGGAILFGWGGASVASRLGLSGIAEVGLAAFAVGVVLMSMAPVIRLSDRLRRLEAGQSAEKPQY